MTNLTKSLAVSALLMAAACSSSSAIEASEKHFSTGRIRLAFNELELAYQAQKVAGSVDPELERAYREMLPIYLTEVARQRIYANQEVLGKELLDRVLELEPGDVVAQGLMLRALHKMAVRATVAGQDFLGLGKYEDAIASFGEALEFEAGHEPAMEGIVLVKERVSQLHEEAQQQFLEAVRKLPQFRYEEVDWHAGIAVRRDPSREDAVKLRNKALREQAERAMERAEDSRDEGVYGAALMEFRTVRHFWPETPGVDELVSHMEREVQAQQKIERAMLMLNADRLDKARGYLGEASGLTSLQAGWINELQHMIRKRESEIVYEHARDLELQGLKAEALAGFQEVVAAWPGGLLDEKVRVSALQLDIKGAEDAYAEGEAQLEAGEFDAALESFLTAQTYYEKYRDVVERVRLLRERIAGGAGG